MWQSQKGAKKAAAQGKGLALPPSTGKTHRPDSTPHTLNSYNGALCEPLSLLCLSFQRPAPRVHGMVCCHQPRASAYRPSTTAGRPSPWRRSVKQIVALEMRSTGYFHEDTAGTQKVPALSSRHEAHDETRYLLRFHRARLLPPTPRRAAKVSRTSSSRKCVCGMTRDLLQSYSEPTSETRLVRWKRETSASSVRASRSQVRLFCKRYEHLGFKRKRQY